LAPQLGQKLMAGTVMGGNSRCSGTLPCGVRVAILC
jgi:hypothetical protein